MLISVPTPPAVDDPNHVREGYRIEELTAMLHERGLELIATDYCMYAAFKSILRLHRRWGRWLNRIALRTLATVDRFCRLGKPMDLIILAGAPVDQMETAAHGREPAVHAR